MAYIETKTLAYPLTWADIKARTPNTCWPDGPSVEMLREHGYEVVHPVPQPSVAWMKTAEGDPEHVEGVGWRQTWVEIPKSADESAAALEAALAATIAAVKAEAGRRILEIAPEWKQRNLTARAAELPLLYPGMRGVDLPEPERSEYLVGQAIWSRIKAIREASNRIEEKLLIAADSGEDAAGLYAIDTTVGWPE